MKHLLAGWVAAIILVGCKLEYTEYTGSLSYTSSVKSQGRIDRDCIEESLLNDPQFESANYWRDVVIVHSNGFDVEVTFDENKLVISTTHKRESEEDGMDMSVLSNVSENIKESLLHSCPLRS